VVNCFMASVPYELFGVLTKNTHWDTDAAFLQLRLGFASN